MNRIIIKLDIPVWFRNAHRESLGVMARDALVACQTAVTLQYRERKQRRKIKKAVTVDSRKRFDHSIALSTFIAAQESQRELINYFATNERRDAISHSQPRRQQYQ